MCNHQTMQNHRLCWEFIKAFITHCMISRSNKCQTKGCDFFIIPKPYGQYETAQTHYYWLYSVFPFCTLNKMKLTYQFNREKLVQLNCITSQVIYLNLNWEGNRSGRKTTFRSDRDYKKGISSFSILPMKTEILRLLL